MLRTRTVVRGVVLLVVALAAWLAVPVLWLEIDESAMPPASSFPSLPDGARVASVDEGCGSGGCWHELAVDAPAGMSREELEAAVLPDGASCAFQGVLDLRRVCTGVIDVDREPTRFYVQYRRLMDQ